MNKFRQFAARFAVRAWSVVKLHRRSLNVLLPLLGVILLVDIATFSAGFASNDDPGTYASQAWAILNRGELAHYTYWYDHPPLGWVQIALYAWVTRGFERSNIDVLMAGELMVVAQLVGCVLIFMLMRRLTFNRAFAALAVGLFALSPLAIFYQKMAFLDNLAVTWLLASIVFAVSPRRSLASGFGAGICLVVATLTKETSAIWLPVVLYMLWQNYGKGHRSWGIWIFGLTYFLTGAFYVIYALLKGELLPGDGHVSLWGALIWQLTRSAAGGDTVNGWLQVDHWLLYAAVLTAPFGLFFRRLRPIVLGFALMAAMVLRGGYIPAPFVIGVLPFAALLIAAVLACLWPHRLKVVMPRKKLLVAARMAVVVAVATAGVMVCAPGWAKASHNAMSRAEVLYYQETVEWIKQNVPLDAVIAVDDNTWLDLYQAGYHNVVWFYKLDLDPAVQKKYVPDGYKGIDYIAMKQLYYYIARDSTDNSIISEATKNSALVAEFGNPGKYSPEELTNLYVVYKVKK